MACKCYHAERNFIGKIGVCWGTKECEACSCGGDESKCDFYEDKRKKVTPKITNADRIRAMSDEELASLLQPICPPIPHCPDEPPHNCRKCVFNWLRQEA